MSIKRIQHIQDSTHGLMEFYGMETAAVEVLRAKELQRLRRVRQLGLAHLIYPGAEHSRLVHSLGAAHLAIRFAKKLHEHSRSNLCAALQLNDSAIRDIALAALVHDLGHGPFSHVWEHEVIGEMTVGVRQRWLNSLMLDEKEKALEGVIKWHELVTQGLLAWQQGELHQLLEQLEAGTATRIRYLLMGQYYLPYLPRLLSSDIDVDRCDFILRDSKQAGVTYGSYDLPWLIANINVGVHGHRSNELVIGFDAQKTDRAVEQFILARRSMYEKVYYHRAVKSAEVMLGLVMRRLKYLVNDGRTVPWQQHPIFAPIFKLLMGEGLSPVEILGLDDYLVWSLIVHIAESTGEDPTLTDLAQRLVRRKLFKIVRCEDRQIDNLLDHSKLTQLLTRLGNALPEKDAAYYYKVERSPMSLFSDDESGYAYFLDGNRGAYPIREHRLLRAWTDQPVRRFLFVPEEARRPIEELLRQSR